jgi:hypothetical protein
MIQMVLMTAREIIAQEPKYFHQMLSLVLAQMTHWIMVKAASQSACKIILLVGQLNARLASS